MHKGKSKDPKTYLLNLMIIEDILCHMKIM